MAPSPEHDKEPKAPDKSHSRVGDASSGDNQTPAVETQQNLDTSSGAVGPTADPEESGQLESLDEGQLRALLDEAVNYKRPKDREGKSSLFKELLQEVEQDSEPLCVWGRVGGGARRKLRRGAPALAHSGSLQDLAGEEARHPRHRRHRPPPPVPVSARCLQGGSLPANVDQQNFGVVEGRRSFLEDVRGGGGGDYIATVRCVNPPPLGESGDYMLLDLAPLPGRAPSPPCHHPRDRSPKLPRIPVNYTTCATLEIGGGGGSGGDNLSLVDSTRGCIPSPAVSAPLQLASYCAVKSVTGEAPLTPASHLSFLNISQIAPVSMPGPRIYQPPKHDSDYKKSLDENGNSVPNLNSNVGSGQHSKKSKLKQKVKNETQTMSEYIDGYRGREDLNDILKFIESNADDAKHPGKAHSKANPALNGKVSTAKSREDNDNDKGAKKRSTERRSKDCKMDKLKKANSMEELSRSKLDDLTIHKDSLGLRNTDERSANPSDLADSKRNDRRSWGNDGSDTYYPHVANDADDSFSTNLSNSSSARSSIAGQTIKPKKLRPARAPEVELPPSLEPSLESADFQTVTSKKKIRKKHSPCDENRGRTNNSSYSHNSHSSKNGGRFSSGFTVHDRDVLYKRRSGSVERRHPSASSPPSDKSNDSNDDLDSVHSLPAEASGERLQASYADMARAAAAPPPLRPPPVSPPPPMQPPAPPRHRNFPDLIESCNYYSDDRLPRDKYLDVSTENTKNLLLEENSPSETVKCEVAKSNIVDTGTQMEQHLPHPTYTREQYPALEPRSGRPGDKSTVKTKTETKVPSNGSKPLSTSTKLTTEKKPISKTESGGIDGSTEDPSLVDDHDPVPDHYVAFVKHSTVNSLNRTADDSYRPVDGMNSTKISFLPGKLDNFMGKPPDVVLPLTDMTQSSENRPAVIIMNEEVHNIDGITFGFDINEQLLNGEAIPESRIENGTATAEETEGIIVQQGEVNSSIGIMYDSNIEFPAINEKPNREHDKAKAHDPKAKVRRPEPPGARQAVQMGTRSLHYLAPAPKDGYNLDMIVHYVGMAWEDIMKAPGGEVRYFNEQP